LESVTAEIGCFRRYFMAGRNHPTWPFSIR
jgi:hypothetical protein